ncbi:hypothetical protein EW145_g3250 [Phellinidium pouzarii]|uniref:M protein, serotype 2.1 n=1 Tax=Phellinidium pouzarii TaxID=167371 RepID=A0A4S4LD40_9AGAM|nr:hypothetical protein EW145_g3250 [Phellinidium pouzarii]
MATSAARTPASHRTSSTFTAPTTASIARGATARSAVSPKVHASLNGVSRRGSTSKASLSSNQDGETASREGLTAALKRETEEKEELLIRVQNKEQGLAELTTENINLSANLNAAETRLAELYADQARIEEETVARLDLVDRLRAQVQELEREKREVVRRYNEQRRFDAERQSFYDNEQHLKSRIQSLVQARRTTETPHKPGGQEDDGAMSEAEELQEEPAALSQLSGTPHSSEMNNTDESAEMTSLRLELSTLSTSYASLQTTVQHLSSQLLDLKRVNNHLQEENESYNILLREKTLNGQFDILRTVGTKESDEGSVEEGEFNEGYEREDQSSLHSADRTPLDRVDELAEDMDSGVYGEDLEQNADIQDDVDSVSSTANRESGRRMGRGGRRVATSSRSPAQKGESLADLPVAGPGLDLAAELGRAENQAILKGREDVTDSRDRSVVNPKGRRGKQKSVDQKASDVKLDSNLLASSGGDLDALRTEVKSLKDANKALSLYASKIIDRIIAQEGFEHVLAADYEKPPPSPVKKQQPKKIEETAPKKKARPQSAIFGLAFPSTEPYPSPSDPLQAPEPMSPIEGSVTTRVQRRSMSFDWKSFSMFGGSAEKKPEVNPNLRPLSLRPGGSSVVGARKLDTFEDEEDRKERERLNAVMKLMGIEKPQSVPPSPFLGSPSSSLGTSSTPNPQSETTSPRTVQPSRFSFFRSRSNTSDNSVNTTNSLPINACPKSNLTAEALEHAEAETTLAALDEREKVLSAEIAKGANGGFTELPNRRQRGEEWRSRRSRQSGESGSGSTVWSAGMSTHREGDSGDEGNQAR